MEDKREDLDRPTLSFSPQFGGARGWWGRAIGAGMRE